MRDMALLPFLRTPGRRFRRPHSRRALVVAMISLRLDNNRNAEDRLVDGAAGSSPRRKPAVPGSIPSSILSRIKPVAVEIFQLDSISLRPRACSPLA